MTSIFGRDNSLNLEILTRIDVRQCKQAPAHDPFE